MVKDAVDTLKAEGLDCDIVGGGGTGGAPQTADEEIGGHPAHEGHDGVQQSHVDLLAHTRPLPVE